MDQVRSPALSRSRSVTGAAAGLAVALLVVLAFGVQACSISSASGPEPGRELSNAQPSPEALASRFLERLAADDLEGMKSLRLTQQEFCTVVFPELPASKLPNVSCDWVWSQATLKSMAGLTRTLNVHRGEQWELISVRFAGTEEHQTYRVLKDPTVSVRDMNGKVENLRLFGSVLELDGQYKLFSFVTD